MNQHTLKLEFKPHLGIGTLPIGNVSIVIATGFFCHSMIESLIRNQATVKQLRTTKAQNSFRSFLLLVEI